MARIWLLHTPVILADLSIGAVWVCVAFIVTASDGVRLGNKARLTLADSIVVSIDGAGSVRATWMRLAGVLEVKIKMHIKRQIDIQVRSVFYEVSSLKKNPQ